MITATRSGSLPALLRDVIREQQGYLPSGERAALQSNVSLEEAEQIYSCVHQAAPLHSLEVGLAQGVSSVAILQALQDAGRGIHHVIDPFQDRYQNAGLALIEKAGLSQRLDFHQRFPEEVIPHLGELDFVFIDSSHLFDLTIMEFVLADKKLAVGGLLALHDLWMPSMQAVARYVLANRAYQRHECSSEKAGAPRRGRMPRFFGRCLRTVPKSAGLFRAEALEPLAFADSNLLVLRKTGLDNRDWRLHKAF